MPMDGRLAAHAAHEDNIDAEAMMARSPFAIPPKPPGQKVAQAMEQGDVRSFLLALGIIFGLVAAIGFAVLPGY